MEGGGREGEEWTDGWMYGWMGRSAGAPGTGGLCCCQCPWGHRGIKALHINTIMKEKKKKVKRCDEEMENGVRPFYFFSSLSSPRAMPPPLTSLLFGCNLSFSLSLPLSLSSRPAPSFHPLLPLPSPSSPPSEEQQLCTESPIPSTLAGG